MIRNRLANLMNRLTQGTVLSALMEPAWRALEGVRGAERASPVLDMQQFITLGALRHLQEVETLREQSSNCSISTSARRRWRPWHARSGPLPWPLDGAPYTDLVDVLHRIDQRHASEVEQLTPKLWKQRFADDPLRSDLHRDQS